MQSRPIFFFLVLSILFSSHVSGEDARSAVAKIAPRLVRINTIGGHEKVGTEFANEGTGSGLLLDREGYVLTSAFHFLHDPSSILLRFADGSKKVAKKVATDRNRMLTLLKVEEFAPDFLSETFSLRPKDSIEVGETCFAVGVALSEAEPNIARGILSGKNRIWGKAIQTDAAVGPNNYGGPLVDKDGNLLGILVPLSMMSSELTAGAETYDAGVGMAVPMEDVESILPKLKQGIDLEPGFLGIEFKENRIFMGEAILDEVREGSPAEKGGLKIGDKIVAVDGKPIQSALELSMNLKVRYADETLALAFLRDGKTQIVSLKTEPKKSEKNENVKE